MLGAILFEGEVKMKEVTIRREGKGYLYLSSRRATGTTGGEPPVLPIP